MPLLRVTRPRHSPPSWRAYIRPWMILAAFVAVVVIALLALTACGSGSAARNDRTQTDRQLGRYQANQPVPDFDWSAYRQTAIDIESAKVHAVATTTFFFNQGATRPIRSCPSLGFPIPSTVQLTNPMQEIGGAGATIGQMEPNGTYTGESSATYVVCAAPDGTRYVVYWEGFVYTEGGPARWNDDTGMVELTGKPTVTTKRK